MIDKQNAYENIREVCQVLHQEMENAGECHDMDLVARLEAAWDTAREVREWFRRTIEEEEARKPEVFIYMEGGLISTIISDIPGLEAFVVDYDIEGADEDELIHWTLPAPFPADHAAAVSLWQRTDIDTQNEIDLAIKEAYWKELRKEGGKG